MTNGHFWHNKKVLVTGHTGFSGGWLVCWLNQLGAKVTGISLPPPTKPAFFDLCNVASLTHNSFFLDITDQAALLEVLSKEQFDLVFHLAAQPLVVRGYENPVETFMTNTMGTVHLLDALRQQSHLRSVVVVTTDKCYENREWLWHYRENDTIGGQDPYSSSKACTELITAAYRASYFDKTNPKIGVSTARAGNLVGGGDWSPQRIVPDCVQAFLSGMILPIRNPRATRPWQHLLNALHGYLNLAEMLFTQPEDLPHSFNFGPDEDAHLTVVELIEALNRHLPFKWRIDESTREVAEKQLLKLDSSLARATLNWKPQLKLDDGLRLVAEWTRVFQNGGNLLSVTQNQIESYQKLLERST
jgi:CDP-glucose 4,6-dehydratase